ncbi:MAG TPA: Uma2 family endonuclease [Thermoanaerobaculia bacterium]|nr:Uma2 family endonuclease [Thermoanaerobaculia bacterium]
MTVHTKHYVTPEEYLALERAAERKSEYLDGELVGMTGASRRHSLIAANVIREIGQQLKGRPCEVLSGDMRIWVLATGLYTYADVVAVCGEPALADGHFDTLTNPTVLVEVLSPSTKDYDRGTKFVHYRALDSLREYLLVSQDQPRVEHYLKKKDGDWLLSEKTDLAASVVLPSIGCRLAMAEIYDRVRFEP